MDYGKELKNVEIKSVEVTKEPQFLEIKKVIAERDGQEVQWEMVQFKDSVHILVDSVDTRELLFVRQNRIPVMVNDPDVKNGVIELCAGLIDKDLEPIEIAKEEILEEMGYKVKDKNIAFVRTLKSTVGMSGSTNYIYYCQVSLDDKVSEGGGIEGEEDIAVVRIPYEEVVDVINDANVITDSITAFMMAWWSLNEQSRLVKQILDAMETVQSTNNS